MARPSLDVGALRRKRNYTGSEMAKRFLWGMAEPLFRFSPRILYPWRNMVLRLLGARIGKGVRVSNTATVFFPWNLEIGAWSAIGDHAYIYNLGPVRIGEKVTISHRAHLCAGTHDHTDLCFPLMKPPIGIGNQAWVCADAFIGPGVTVGEGAIVGARAVAVRNVADWTVVAGNPARPVNERVIRAKEPG